MIKTFDQNSISTNAFKSEFEHSTRWLESRKKVCLAVFWQACDPP
jgi:hypothetical protein